MKGHLIITAVICLPLWPHKASADCSNIMSNFDTGVCQAQTFGALNESLNHSYQQLYRTLPPDGQWHLRQEELAWIRRRDKDCAITIGYGFFINFDCAVRLTQARAVVLQNRLLASALPMAPKGAYIGPGDLVPGAIAYYGLRAYNATYAKPGTNRAIKIRRNSDNLTEDITILTSGSLDIQAANVFCASTSCYVVEWYDQSGHDNNIIQATPSEQPKFVLNQNKSLPIVQFNFDSQTYLSASFRWVSGNEPWAGQVVLMNAASTNWYEPIFDYGTTATNESLFALVYLGREAVYQFGTSIYDSDAPSGIPTNAPAALSFYSTGSEIGGYVNGVHWGKPFSSSEITGDSFVLGGSPRQSGIWLTGDVGEVILYPLSLSAASAQSLADSERQYYGF